MVISVSVQIYYKCLKHKRPHRATGKQNCGQSLDCRNMVHEPISCTEPNLYQSRHSANECCQSLEMAEQIPTTNVSWHRVKFRIIKFHYHNAYMQTNPEKLTVSQLVKITSLRFLSLPCLYQPTTCPYHKQYGLRPHNPNNF
jgi:hypothetical protein